MELRLVLTVADFDRALAFYADALGLERFELWTEAGARGALLDAGRATLELIDEGQAALVIVGESRFQQYLDRAFARAQRRMERQVRADAKALQKELDQAAKQPT
jgi:catechol 2,3-dioxygenase-like lactoylglutathione lyase family enzyme